MRKIFLVLAICVGGLASCKPDGYTVKGRLEEMEGKKIYLVAQNEGFDTLAQTEVKNGEFIIQGKVDEILPATLYVEGMLFTAVFLENHVVSEIELLPNHTLAVKAASETQRLYNDYVDIDIKKGIEQMDNLATAIVEASRRRDTVKVAEIRQRMDSLHIDLEREKEAYRWNNCNTYFGLYALSSQVFFMDAVTAKKWFALCSDELKATKLGKSVQKKVETLCYLAVGAKVPDCTALTPEGDSLSLYGLKAKVKLIDFWSSTCGRCRVENKLLIPFYKEYHARGFEILSISLDTKHDAWVRAIERDGLPWPQVSDLKGSSSTSLAAFYGVPSLPYTILVDEDNRVIARDIHYEQLKNCIPELLKK